MYAGGCALNSSANNILTSKKYFENFFIPMAPGDNGGAIGAALLVNSKYNLNQKNFSNPYLGNFYNDNEVCLLYTSPSPRDRQKSRMPSSA